jgi:hypothetical protein
LAALHFFEAGERRDVPKRRDLLERLSVDDPNYEVAKRFYLEAWADSHGLVADALSGRASLSDFVDGCVKTFARGAELHVALKDSASSAEKCKEMDSLAKEFIRKFSRSLAPHSERLGEGDVKAAVDELSRRVNEIAARSKQRFFDRPLTPKLLAAPSTEPMRQSNRAILLHRLVPDRVAQVKVPKITYEFPVVFSEIAKRRFQAKKLRAERVLEEKKGSARKFADAETLLLEFILDVFFALVEELYLLGMQGHLGVEEFESECLKFLQASALGAGFMDNRTLVPQPTPHDAEIPDDVWTKIESSPEWKSYRRRLQKVADAQAGGESSHPDLEDALLTSLPELADGNTFAEDGWTPIPHADLREDAAYARKPPPFLRPVKVPRLHAIAALHKAAAAAVQSALPPTKQQLELCLWPALSKYAQRVFDKMAEAKLNARRPGGRAGTYARWLRSKCLPAVVDDVCGSVFSQFRITVRYVIEIIGEPQSPEIELTKRMLWGMLTEVFGDKPFTENLRKRLSTHLEGRSTRWEGKAVQPPQAAGPRAEKVVDSARPDLPAKKGGRPVILVDGERIKELRGESSQTAFARLCKISVDALQRAERRGRSSEKTIRRIVRKLQGQGRKIESKDLIKNTPL